MDCPRCRRALERADEGLFADIETHVCRACGGTFYPPGSLDRFDDALAVNVEAIALRARPEPPLRCPVGHASRTGAYRSAGAGTLQASEVVEDAGVVVAVCEECRGFWLEGDALERLRELAARLSSTENAALNRDAIEEKRRRESKSDS